jgi:DNA-binding XRE family transcriptional regulator
LHVDPEELLEVSEGNPEEPGAPKGARTKLVANIAPRRMRELRQSLLKSQQQVASDAGVDLSTYQRAERGGRIGLQTVRKIARALRVEPEELLGAYEGRLHGSGLPKYRRPTSGAEMSDKRAVCLVSDCDRPAKGRGLCPSHYNRWYRGEKLPAVLTQQQAPPLALPSSEADLGYLAALLDREGKIYLATYGEYWRVRFRDTDKEFIDWLATIGGVTTHESLGTKQKDLWVWTLANQKDVHDFLSAVLPHLKNPAKRDQAREAVDAIATKEAPPLRPGRGRPLERPEN